MLKCQRLKEEGAAPQVTWGLGNSTLKRQSGFFYFFFSLNSLMLSNLKK